MKIGNGKIAILISFAFLLGLHGGCSSEKDYNSYASICGTVVDSKTGEAIRGATVTLLQGGEKQATGADGHFEFDNIEPQRYTILVQCDGYQENRATVTAVVGEKTEVSIPLTKK